MGFIENAAMRHRRGGGREVTGMKGMMMFITLFAGEKGMMMMMFITIFAGD